MQTSELYANKAVIVRAHGDRPVKLTLHRIDKSHCYVGNTGSMVEIGVPSEQVFAFSEELYEKLSAAFQTNDFHNLHQLYTDIPVDDFACNKYQDKL